MIVIPLYPVKCNMQIDPAKNENIMSGFEVFLKEQGFQGLFPWLGAYLAWLQCPGCLQIRILWVIAGFAKDLADGLPKFVKSEGTLGLYKGIICLCGEDIFHTL
ncbi:hypothetical protein VNO80_19550 [Phaseolus coccineus]|uniref:Uncharacterized protein n=1 Tax=Phaseolus coccineus TaxID=3886 RepID=A0AAN9QZV9_PHACN